MNSTPEELKISYIVELFPRGEKEIVEGKTEPPHKKTKIDTKPPHITATASWTDFQNQILGEVKSMNDKLSKLEEGQKNNERLVKQVLGILYNINDNVEGNPTTSRYIVLF